MAHRRWWVVGLIVAGVCACLRAEPPGPLPDKPHHKTAARIDQLITARLTDEKVPPAPLADDAEFLRRIYLDLTGRIPSVAQVRAFLKDQTPDKRQRLLEQLLESGAYVQH